MTTWNEFTAEAPRIAGIFRRRHAATGNLCLLGTVRADGSPRISPIEPRVFEDRLWMIGMPDTTKFRDLHRDPRFCVHTATVDTQVTEGDAKLWGTVADVRDLDLHRRFAEDLFADIGLDLRGSAFDHFYEAHLTSASSVEIVDGHMEVTVWKPGQGERVVRKT
jgi:hypothetical protein